jgi:topoisomerase IV subunit A
MGELTEVQAEAILNMRLRSLRRLEEMELVARARPADEGTGRARRPSGERPPAVEARSGKLEETRKRVRKGQPLGRPPHPVRRGEAKDVPEVPAEAMIEREPITVICSKRWAGSGR